jgi:peroxin-2
VPEVPALRVNQLDAQRLDDEVYEILKGQFVQAFSLFHTSLIDRFQPEVNAILSFVIFRLSTFESASSYGDKLENLVYRVNGTGARVAAKQRILYGAVLIGGGWLWARANRFVTNEGWGDSPVGSLKRRAWALLGHLETVWKLGSLVNFVMFLYNGRYRSLLDLLLGQRMGYIHPTMARSLNFEYMNRLLVWHGFTEFLMFLMPLINVERVKAWIQRKFAPPRLAAPSASPDSCPICSAQPINTPYVTNCGHFFCYYCLQQNRMMDPHYPCPRCGCEVSSARRHQGEQEPAASSGNAD